jgi:succinylarginine dihydrolase
LAAAHQKVFLTDPLHDQLKLWIGQNYREELRSEDLADPRLLTESRAALDELTKILDLRSIYDFQRA